MIYVGEDFRLRDMRLHGSVRALQLNALPRSRDGIDGGMQNVFAGLLVDVGAALSHFHELGLATIGVEHEDAATLRQAQAGRNGRRRSFFFFTFGALFGVNLAGLSLGCSLGFSQGGVVFLRGRPVHQRGGHLLPLIALGAEVVHAVALHLPFGYALKRAVFQDQAFGPGLSVNRRSGDHEPGRAGGNDEASDE